MEPVYSYNGNDGFGSQYHKIVVTYIYCTLHNRCFRYTPLTFVEHNDPEYIPKLEDLMNLKDYIPNITSDMQVHNLPYHCNYDNMIGRMAESDAMQFVKLCFWKNKSRDFFKNQKINVAVHIRRENAHDNGRSGFRVTTPNSYYLNVMNMIRKKYRNVFFHIYSQGVLSQFSELEQTDVAFHLNEDIITTFIGMVAAECLVLSPSSFSYIAALLSDGEIYYKPFSHKPLKNWVVIASRRRFSLQF